MKVNAGANIMWIVKGVLLGILLFIVGGIPLVIIKGNKPFSPSPVKE